MTETDKARLDFLLSTWEARKQLSEQILIEMRNTIGTRIVSINGIRRNLVRIIISFDFLLFIIIMIISFS